jgi:hypothetical protein
MSSIQTEFRNVRKRAKVFGHIFPAIMLWRDRRIDSASGHPHTPRLSCPVLRGCGSAGLAARRGAMMRDPGNESRRLAAVRGVAAGAERRRR